LIGFVVLFRVWSTGRGAPADHEYAVVGHDHVHEPSAGHPGYS
jgi:hypothetical protein